MKKIFTPFLFICVATLSAQITYTEADGPKVGVNVSTRQFDELAGLDANALLSPGGNKSWDVRGLYTETGTTAYESSESLYFKSLFPGVNLTQVEKPNPDSSYTMMQTNSSGLYILGSWSPEVAIVYDPKLLLAPYPLNFGANFQNDAIADFSQGGFNFRNEIQTNSTVEAWGTMTTNEGTYPTIKLKTKAVQYTVFRLTGDIISNATIETHTWHTSGFADPLVTYNAVETEVDTFVFGDTSLTNSYNQRIVSNKDFAKFENKLTISPNPVTDYVTIKCKDLDFNSATYSIVNAEGKTVMEGNLNSNETLQLNLNQLASGNYLIQLLLDKKTLLFDILTKK
jgi:hypothetical protein